MRHAKYIIGSLIIVAMATWSLYEWIFLSKGPAYFADDWRRAALVAVLAITGGLTFSGFMKLPDRMRRRLADILLGAGAVLSILGCAYSLWGLYRLREYLSDLPYFWLFTAFELAAWSLLGVLCIWLKRHYGRQHENNANQH